MAGTTPRAASRRAPAHGAESRRDALVVLATMAVLAVTAVIVLAGLYLTRYRPPRAAALTVDGATYTAAQVEHRLRYLMFYEPAAVGNDPTQFVTKTLERLEREEIMRQRAPALVGDLDADGAEQQLRKALAPPPPPAPTTDTPGVTVAQPTVAPLSDEQYATALQDRLRAAGMSKRELEAVARAEALDAKLREHFGAGLGTAGPQLQLVVARLADRAKADQVRAIALRPGVNFAQVANVNSVGGAGPTGNVGWVLPEELKPSVRDVVQALQAGAVSEVTPNGIYLEVYQVVATEASREYAPDQRDTLVQQQVDAWLAAERAQVRIERVLSTETERWIRDRAIAAFRARNGQPGG